MAIKPTDTIIPYGKLISWKREGTFSFTKVYHVEYLKNFEEHVDELVKKHRQELKLLKKHEPKYDMTMVFFKEELRKYNATFKDKPNSNSYIKFKRESDLTYFVLRWS